MEKLQLYITKSLHGYKSLVNINPDGEVNSHIYDFGSALDVVNYDNSCAHIFYLLQYHPNGALITVIRTLPNHQKGSYIGASVFFPLGIRVTTDEITNIADRLVETLDREGEDLSNAAVTSLRELFSKDYAVDADVPYRLPSTSNGTYKCAFFGADAPSLRDYIEARYYDPEFSTYIGVLLVEKETEVTIVDKIYDITQAPLPSTTVLLAPKNSREGFAPYLFGYHLNRTTAVSAGKELTISWQRPGFTPVEQTVVPGAGWANTIKAPDTSLAKKEITAASFYVTEQGLRRQLSNFVLKVNGEPIDDGHEFTYAELLDANVVIALSGYSTFNGNLDLASSARACVQLKATHRTYRFDLPLHTPEPVEAIRIYLKTKDPLTESPVDGYAVVGGEIVEGVGVGNNLMFVGGNSLKSKLWLAGAALVGFLLGFLIAWPIFSSSDDQQNAPVVAPEEVVADSNPAIIEEVPVAQPEVKQEVKAEPAANTDVEPSSADISAACKYLDANKVWRRDEMEQNLALRGLYDAMNSYDFNSIINKWGTSLSASKNFAAVVRAAKGSSTKRDPRTGKHAPLYVNDGDATITWLPYTYWIDP